MASPADVDLSNVVTIGGFAALVVSSLFTLIYFILKSHRQERDATLKKLEDLSKSQLNLANKSNEIMERVIQGQQNNTRVTEDMSKAVEGLNVTVRSSASTQDAFTKLLTKALEPRFRRRKKL